jgi:Holliday junction resolvase-like predicted endonuclease
MAQHNKTGQIGEKIACKYLKENRFRIIEQNYRKKYGEIDIVAHGTNTNIHFVEVKTVSYETRRRLEESVTRETWRPEEMVHTHKRERFKRVIEVWLSENDSGYECDWQIDVITVKIVPREKYARVKWLKNLVFE